MRKKIPYGLTDFDRIQKEHYYYVDKTMYIPTLEAAGNFLFLIRPRRFGKSLWLIVLESYYDIDAKDDFDALFGGTYIHDHPTDEKHAYLILKFNFSAVNPNPEKVEASFNSHAENRFFFFGKKYREILDDDYFAMMAKHEHAYEKLEFLLDYIGTTGYKVYVMIDEYDNFANTILTTYGQASYHELTHGAGFFRFFFNVLKESTTSRKAGLSRLFITGVSPVTMDDVTSGFNIGRNISLDVRFNELLGFTGQEVSQIVTYYQEHGMSVPDLDELMGLMKEWYDNYRFSKKAVNRVFNADMALYFVLNFLESGDYPDDMIDENVKIDYRKLRHLVVLDRALNGNFLRLSEIIETGEVQSNVVKSFPVEELINPENFVSLLFYFGLLSYIGIGRLAIPNRTVRTLMYSYLREGYRDVDVFRIDFWRFANQMRDMAYKGAWEPVFRLLADEVERQTSIRDYLTGEKVIQTFLLAYLNVTDVYITRSEEEMGMGFADLYLEPFLPKYPDVKYGYLIELKYMKRGEYTEERLQENLTEARNQLRKYARDERISRRKQGITMKCLTLIFCGWEMKLSEELSLEM